jgi:CIC family chloride channel protein
MRRWGWLAVGLMGYFFPQVLGVGYSDVEKVLAGDLVLKVVVILAVLKIVATAVCYASGNAGGIFGPSLFIGAMMGASVGSVAHLLAPRYTAGPGAYALVGMGSAFAGIVRTPLTSVIMIFEVTRDYTIIVPLMISNLIAFFISHRLQPEPIYEALARQDGIHLPSGEARAHRQRMRVSIAMRAPLETLSPKLSVAEAFARTGDSELAAWPVIDQSGLVGMIQRSDLESANAKGDQGQLLEALLRERPSLHRADSAGLPHVHPDHSLTLALERMGTTRLEVLPVVSRANIHHLLGVITLHDILEAYGVAPALRGAGRP